MSNDWDTHAHDFGYYTTRQLADLLGVDMQKARRYKKQGRVTWIISGRWVCNWCGNTDRSAMVKNPYRATCKRCLPAYEHHAPWVTYQEWLARGCGICGLLESWSKRLCIDHDHACCPGRRSCGKCVRGILCDFHNLLAGQLDAGEVERTMAWIASRGVPITCDVNGPGRSWGEISGGK